ncbi:GntR family transcriptional regulator (plasmid) [Roseivivax marinus]|uniref:GntR family transcriptional regulator n=1 Tax=Roseivivax marinus TaxID=1379903 RepID=UPI001F033E50|nr:GntR family transcriptional regulator [Roseivivax marinus]UMA67092.1 GntR family transcriptional regulator [Roseivivax marinus]
MKTRTQTKTQHTENAPANVDAFGQSGERLAGDALVQDVTARLEEAIVFGRLLPRERLIEEDLSQQFDLKRHVIRQAIVELERLGLVERIRNRGAVVKVYSAKEVEDINAVRELLESHAATLVPLPLEQAARERLRALQRRHHEAVEAGNRREVFRANIAFHEELFSHCGNDALIEAIRTHAQKSHAYRSIFVNDTHYLLWAAQAHLDMIKAIEAEDREALVRLCREHLAPAMKRYVETIRSQFD